MATSPIDFMTRYEEEAGSASRERRERASTAPERAEKRAAKVARDRATANAVIDPKARAAAIAKIEDREPFRLRLQEQIQADNIRAAARLETGFLAQDQWIGDSFRRGVTFERGLRSDALGEVGKRFVAGCPKRLRSANEKGMMRVETSRKVLNLDNAWVEANRAMVSLVRVDLDGIFKDFEQLEFLLQEIMDDGYLVCMPHLVVGEIRQSSTLQQQEHYGDTFLSRPHLWFVLPAAVNCTETGRDGPKKLLASVYRGLLNILAPLGADPQAALMLARGKNPLSPWWAVEVFNGESFPLLSEYAEKLEDRMNIGRQELSRQAAAIQSGGDKEASNAAFTGWQREAYDILRAAHADRHPDYLAAVGNPDAIAEFLRPRMSTMDIASSARDAAKGMSPERAAYVFEKVVSYAASSWDPDVADKPRVNRGRLSHVVDGIQGGRKRQAAAGKAVANERADASMNAIADEIERFRKAGTEPTQADVARSTGLHRNTVGRRWHSALSECTRRSIDIKVTHHPVRPKEQNQAQAEEDKAMGKPIFGGPRFKPWVVKAKTVKSDVPEVGTVCDDIGDLFFPSSSVSESKPVRPVASVGRPAFGPVIVGPSETKVAVKPSKEPVQRPSVEKRASGRPKSERPSGGSDNRVADGVHMTAEPIREQEKDRRQCAETKPGPRQRPLVMPPRWLSPSAYDRILAETESAA